MSRAILEVLSGKRWDDHLYSEPAKTVVREWKTDELKSEALRLVHGEGGYSREHVTRKEDVLFLHSLRELARKELVTLGRDGSRIVSAKVSEKGLDLLASGQEIAEPPVSGKECPRCGYLNEEGAQACITCGESLSKTEVDIAREEGVAFLQQKRGRKWARFDVHAEEHWAELGRLRLRYAGWVLLVFLASDWIVEFDSYCRLGMLLGSLIVHGAMAYGTAYLLTQWGGGMYVGMLTFMAFYVAGSALRLSLGFTAFDPALFVLLHLVFELWGPVIGGLLIGHAMEDSLRRTRGAG